MISHKNVIANVLQISAFEKTHRDALAAPGGPQHTEVVLGLLPQSHIYALVVMCHTGPYRGDQVIVLPKFELKSYLASIQHFKIGSLFLVRTVIDYCGFLLLISLSGPANYHYHAPKPRGLQEVRPQLGEISVHWGSSSGYGNSRGFPKDVPRCYSSARLW